MLDDSKAISAKDIVKDPEFVYGLNRAIVIVTDTSMTNTFSNMVDALNILYEAGWEVEAIATTETYAMNVILKNTHYKRKNG
jgi:hypothetical protein